MAGYQKPGILVTEVDTPNTTIVLDRPTVVGLVGQARGNEVRSEVVFLTDNDPVALTGANAITSPPSSFVVRDVSLNTLYAQGTVNDYTVTTDENGVTFVKRSLHTTMTSTEKTVVVMKTTSPSAVLTANVAFNYGNTTEVVSTSNGGTIAVTGGAPGTTDISLQRAGAYTNSVDYTINLANGRISRASSAYGPNPSDCHIFSGQTVYVSYTTDDGANTYVDEQVVLTGTTATALANENEVVDTDSIIVRNKKDMGSSNDTVTVFTAGVLGTPGVDFRFNFSPTISAPTAFTMVRNIDGPTTIGSPNNNGNVRISYSYIPRNYYEPTLFTSFQDVEVKYGPAFDAQGNVANALSAAAYMCFRAGSNEIIAQPLLTKNDNIKTRGVETNPDHWAQTLENLRGQTAINVLVPIIGQNNLIDDNFVQAIQLKFVDHINAMSNDNEYVIAIFGEDATNGGTVSYTTANPETLQNHAIILGNQVHPERTVLVSPAAFLHVNPVTGRPSYIGGQYVAATLAGMLANNPVQASMTRKQVVGLADVAIFRNEVEKDSDASSGLLVVENKNGLTRVRHAITTDVNNSIKRELNAMRSKFFMIESIRNTLDNNVIGRVMSDSRAPFIVSTQVTGALEFLRSFGAIARYSNVSATINPNSPTSMTIRFNYSLPFAVNNIEVVLSLDSSTGTVTAQ